jgi:Restriction endonuclease XhoI
MALDLADYETKAIAAVQAFWGNRDQAHKAQVATGRIDAGERGAVTSGKNMDGFVALVLDLVRANGLTEAKVHRSRALVTLPGYFRPTKLWDVLILHQGRLVAALEFKSQVGPSFGNNFNNRAEEAIGSAHDFQTAYREGAFGKYPRPFLGWPMLVEDAPRSRTLVRDASPHFPVFPAFQGASYIQRYNILCQRLVQEQLYTAACVIASPRTAVADGQYVELDTLTSLGTLVTAFAAHVAAEAVRP